MGTWDETPRRSESGDKGRAAALTRVYTGRRGRATGSGKTLAGRGTAGTRRGTTPGGGASRRHDHRLDLGVQLEGVLPQLPADPAHLVPAERGGRVEHV